MATAVPPASWGPFAPCHKTVVVLDHGPDFSAACGGEPLHGGRTRKGNSSRSLKCEKSLWTACVEAAVEYNRVVYDLFAFADKQRYLRVVLSDFVARFLAPGNSWFNFPPDILLDHLGEAGGPDEQGDADSCSVLHGISFAVEALTEATDAQRMYRRQQQQPQQQQQQSTSKVGSLRNCGRIVVFTRLGHRDRTVGEIETHLAELVDSRNRLVKSLDNDMYMPLDEVELCVVDVVPAPAGEPLGVPDLDEERGRRYRASARVTTELRRVFAAGQRLFTVAHDMLLTHYGLASTLVSGIPMREETTTGQSVNYDVELLHERAAQDNLVRALGCRSGVPPAVASMAGPHATYTSITLNWVAPSAKQSDGELAAPNTLALTAHRVTPAAVTSRPSMCLMTFVSSGRTVQLDIPAAARAHMGAAGSSAGGGRLISHLLVAHGTVQTKAGASQGGVTYIHSLPFGTVSAVDDPPAISDGAGGRVFDYRMQHFAQLMCQTTLGNEGEPAPSVLDAEAGALLETTVPNAHALANLRTCTERWPITTGETVVYNLSRFEPLLETLGKSVLSPEDVSALNNALCIITTDHLKSEPLANAGQLGGRLKGLKREEQWRLALDELDACIRPLARRSDVHCRIYNALREHLRRPAVHRSELLNLTAAEIFDGSLMTDAGGASAQRGADVQQLQAASGRNASNPESMEVDPNYLLPTGRDKLNVAEYFHEQYLKRYWSKWRDFDKRDPNNPKVELYEALRQRQAAEAADSAAGNVDPPLADRQPVHGGQQQQQQQRQQHPPVVSRPPLSGPMTAR